MFPCGRCNPSGNKTVINQCTWVSPQPVAAVSRSVPCEVMAQAAYSGPGHALLQGKYTRCPLLLHLQLPAKKIRVHSHLAPPPATKPAQRGWWSRRLRRHGGSLVAQFGGRCCSAREIIIFLFAPDLRGGCGILMPKWIRLWMEAIDKNKGAVSRLGRFKFRIKKIYGRKDSVGISPWTKKASLASRFKIIVEIGACRKEKWVEKKSNRESTTIFQLTSREWKHSRRSTYDFLVGHFHHLYKAIGEVIWIFQ